MRTQSSNREGFEPQKSTEKALQDNIADRGHVFHVSLQRSARTDSHTESNEHS